MGRHTGSHKVKTTTVDGFAIREVRPQYWLVDLMIGGKRIRQAYRDFAEAKAYCHAKRREITNKGTQALNLSDNVRALALKAMDILSGTGATIVEAAEEYVLRHPKTQGETFRQTCDRYLAGMEVEGRRLASLEDKRGKFARLCEALGDRQTASIDRLDIEQWIAGRGYRNGTAHAYEGAATTLLKFFKGQKRRSHRTANEKPPATWNVKTVAALFMKAEDETPELVPALAVLFFAGLRPTEMLRLTWQMVDFDGGVIRLTGEETKTRTMRNVELTPNLRAWLLGYRGTGRIVTSLGVYRGKREGLMAKCQIADWPTDVARHTFATMLYNSTHDAAKVMAQLGHFGSAQTFVTHYKGVPVTAEDADAYWTIMPKEQARGRTVVPFAAAG
jgi:integrase